MANYAEDVLESKEDNFKPVFKYFKSRVPPPDLTRAFDPEAVAQVLKPTIEFSEQSWVTSRWLRAPSTWRVACSSTSPKLPQGMLVLRNPFNPSGQAHLATLCVKEWPLMGKTNLVHSEVSRWLDDLSQDDQSSTASRLRWTTLGYHHNWDTKVYSEEKREELPKVSSDPLTEHLQKLWISLSGTLPTLYRSGLRTLSPGNHLHGRGSHSELLSPGSHFSRTH